jgi:putative transposase
MSDYRRAYLAGGTYFFTVVTHERIPVFDCAEHVEILRDAFRKIRKAQPFAIDAIVVLPDHVHCIWRLPEGDADYSSRWREIKKAVSRRIAPASDVRKERTVWQRRFWEHVIRDEEDWRRHMDYIHFNPVKHGLAKCAGLWPWSSFGFAVSKGWYPADWGTSEPASIAGMDRE